ncbi:MAG: polysaccharide deacetylase family protein [Clostridium sp.]|uniref:polysaccharide deacetylase family protein n=1 Tax=Clostridium sp. TaxID=1506 RepID=UPI003F36A53D
MGNRKRKKRGNYKLVIAIVALVVVVVGGTSIALANHKKSEQTKQTDTKTDTTSTNVKKEEVKKPPVKEEVSNKYGYPQSGNNIIDSAKAYAVPANDVFDMVETAKKVNNEKEVFLTFDDGPSENTPKILKILKENDVHATFFAMGSNLESKQNQEYLKEAYESGNAIGNHTYSHDFHKLYPGNSVNVNVFMKEITKTDEMMRNILGDGFNTRVIRMPGGYMSRSYYHDPNLKALNTAYKDCNIVSIDWDAETGDATGNNIAPSKLISTAMKESTNEEHVILLMHDAAAKGTSVTALPDIIKYYKDHGYSFKVIENSPLPNTTNNTDSGTNN